MSEELDTYRTAVKQAMDAYERSQLTFSEACQQIDAAGEALRLAYVIDGPSAAILEEQFTHFVAIRGKGLECHDINPESLMVEVEDFAYQIFEDRAAANIQIASVQAVLLLADLEQEPAPPFSAPVPKWTPPDQTYG